MLSFFPSRNNNGKQQTDNENNDYSNEDVLSASRPIDVFRKRCHTPDLVNWEARCKTVGYSAGTKVFSSLKVYKNFKNDFKIGSL